MNRRRLLCGLALAGSTVASGARGQVAEATGRAPRRDDDVAPFGEVIAGRPPVFPRDHGAHPSFRTEWWYVTGWLARTDATPGQPLDLGFQVTFFRSRTPQARANTSRFAPAQLLFAHVALASPAQGRLLHDQRAARAGFGLAQASADDTSIVLADWSLTRGPDDRYRAQVAADGFALSLALVPSGPPVLQGANGRSQKGPRPEQASYYYSRPQLAVSGQVTEGERRSPVSGRAWLDHEWSSEPLHPDASGWDWIGLNLDDGSALMAFQVRRRDGSPLWRHARFIAGQGAADTVIEDPRFNAVRWWQSPRTNTRYPVEMTVSLGPRTLRLAPLMDDQELDSRASTGVLYWEGAVRVSEAGRDIGRGYLELTGYGSAVRY